MCRDRFCFGGGLVWIPASSPTAWHFSVSRPKVEGANNPTKGNVPSHRTAVWTCQSCKVACVKPAWAGCYRYPVMCFRANWQQPWWQQNGNGLCSTHSIFVQTWPQPFVLSFLHSIQNNRIKKKEQVLHTRNRWTYKQVQYEIRW